MRFQFFQTTGIGVLLNLEHVESVTISDTTTTIFMVSGVTYTADAASGQKLIDVLIADA